MATLKTIVTILNILMILILLFVAKDFNWKNKKDHESIIGFGFMSCLHTANIILIWY